MFVARETLVRGHASRWYDVCESVWAVVGWRGVCEYTVSVPERSKGVDSSSTVFALVGSNPTADIPFCIFRPVHGSFLREYVRVNATN